MFPPGIITARVTFGAGMSFLADALRVQVKVTPSHHLTWAADGTPLAPFTVTREANPGEVGEFQLPVVDQPGFLAEDGSELTWWHYSIELLFYPTVANTEPITLRKTLQPITGQLDVDLDLIPTTDTPEPTEPGVVPTVVSVDGRTGAVDLRDLYVTRAEGLGGDVTELGRNEGGELVAVNYYDDLGQVTGTIVLARDAAGALDTVTETYPGMGTTTTTLTRDPAGVLTRVERTTV